MPGAGRRVVAGGLARRGLPGLDGPQRPGDGPFGGALHREVQCGVHAQSAFVHVLGAESVHQFAPDLLHEVAAGGLVAPQAVAEHDGRLARGGPCRFVDEGLLDHRAEHDVPAFYGPMQVGGRGEAGWGLDQPGEQRRLREIQLGGRRAEVAARGGFGPVQAVTEIDLVQYDSRISCLDVPAARGAGATTISRSFRRRVFSRVRNRSRASC